MEKETHTYRQVKKKIQKKKQITQKFLKKSYDPPPPPPPPQQNKGNMQEKWPPNRNKIEGMKMKQEARPAEQDKTNKNQKTSDV